MKSEEKGPWFLPGTLFTGVMSLKLIFSPLKSGGVGRKKSFPFGFRPSFMGRIAPGDLGGANQGGPIQAEVGEEMIKFTLHFGERT